MEETKRLKDYEPSLIKKFNVVTVSSSTDKQYFKKLTGTTQPNLIVVPNVVDTEFFKPIEIQEESNTILFSGLMDRKANIDACLFFHKEIFPFLKKENPKVRFFVVGLNPHSAIRKLTNDSYVTVTGAVENIRDWLAKAAVVVSPLRIGAGTRNKILQAMAMQKAIVSTSLGAEGLDVTDGKNIMLADDPVSFARKISELLNEPNKRKELGTNARTLIENNYSFKVLENRLNSILSQL